MFKQKIKRLLILSLLVCLVPVSASSQSMNKAWELLKRDNGTTRNYPAIIEILVSNKLYFTSIPYIKEFLTRNDGNTDRKLDAYIDEVISKVGVKQFEVMPEKFLKRSSSPTIKYINAKKAFREGSYRRTLQRLNKAIPASHPVKPFALFLEGGAYSILGKQGQAIKAYQECVELSNDKLEESSDVARRRQYAINRDYCIVGVPRAYFAAGKYEMAKSTYLDLPKGSYIWPEILVEEAWASFYQEEYNRTLGKLVTYKAPILDFIFNPEIDVLRALTYMEMCLWGDAKKVVDNFYNKYEKGANQVEKFLKKHGKDYKYYYLLAKSVLNGKNRGNALINKLLESALEDPTFIELYNNFQKGRKEIGMIKKIGNPRFQAILNKNVRDAMILQRNLIGAYIRKSIELNNHQVKKSLVDMSYIKLEVLSRRKQELYDMSGTQKRERGDLKYLERSDKQYFWTFNGEFWADELGDYVFSLKSECSE